ncbi:hypothetical protein FJU30_05255 [Affinibrenneria salicis]|uniref:YCII-related domain-containing protein n=1 Tax=Affinibrenneria salicis TaxID=2590031 RepID=A0A5J5G452_9GAMM|nr:YciI family protein [Affinibrenneria salicis]KAA9001702.1 hypothetical protein FJU30_05255 [Affinibrenneria salicis]
MYIISLSYKKVLADVDALLEQHVAWLQKNYREGHFLASGRKNPRTGGVILARSMDREQLNDLLKQDPFIAVADYEVIDFQPSMAVDALSALKDL